MLLTIHNLPSHMQYVNVRLLIQSQCGIKADDMILDNLVNEGRSKKVTIGLVGEKQAEILKRKINGMLVEGQQLCVKDQGEQQAGNEKRNHSSGYQKNNSPSQRSQDYQSQAQQSQQGYPTNFNQYQPNYGQGNQPYMSQDQIKQMQMMMMKTQMMDSGGMGYMPPQNPHMDYSGEMQSAIAPQYSYNQQEQNVDSAKKIDRSASTTKNWGRDDYDDYIDQNKGDGDRGDSRNFDYDDKYNNRYPDDQYAFKNNDRAMNERSRSWGRDEYSRYQNYSSNQANRPRSRSPYYYEDRERAVSRDRYQDTGRPDSSFQRKVSAYTAVASTSRQYGGDYNYNSQGFHYVDMYEPASECYYPKSSDRENQSGNRWDQPDNPLPQSRYRWDKRDKASNSAPQSGNRWDKPDNPSPQSGNRWDKRDKPSNPSPQSGNRWDKPSNPSPQSGNRWDKPDNSSPQSGNRWDKRDKPDNPSPQSRGAQPQGDCWGKSSTSQPREPQRPAPPKRNSSQPIIWEDRIPSLVKGNIQPLMQNFGSPPPPKTSKKILHTPQPQKKRKKGKAYTDFIPRHNAAFNLAHEICKQQGLPNAIPNRRRIKKLIKRAVLVRMEVMLKDEILNGSEIIRRYREKFPTSTDREMLEESYEQIAKKPLSPPPDTDDRTSADPLGAVEETTKVEPVEDEVSLIPNEPIVTVVPDKPKNVKTASTAVKMVTEAEIPEDKVNLQYLKHNETVATIASEYSADVTVDNEIKLEKPAIQNIPTQVAPTQPVVQQIVDKLPKYPNADKQTYKDNKKLAAKEFQFQSGYELDPVLMDALGKELAPIIEIFRNELRRSNSGEEARICEIMTRQAINFGKCLHLHVTKRLLDIHTNLILRVFVHGKTPHQSQIENLLRQYGVISLKKSVKQGPLYYIAECANYEGYDQLCEIGSFSQGTETTLVIKPFHIAGPIKKPLRQNKKGRGKGKKRR